MMSRMQARRPLAAVLREMTHENVADFARAIHRAGITMSEDPSHPPVALGNSEKSPAQSTKSAFALPEPNFLSHRLKRSMQVAQV